MTNKNLKEIPGTFVIAVVVATFAYLMLDRNQRLAREKLGMR